MSTEFMLLAANEEIAMLRASLRDADLLLGPGWRESVASVQGGVSDPAGVLSVQCAKLAGELATSEANVQRLVEAAGPFASWESECRPNISNNWPLFDVMCDYAGHDLILTVGDCRKLAAVVKEVTGG